MLTRALGRLLLIVLLFPADPLAAPAGQGPADDVVSLEADLVLVDVQVFGKKTGLPVDGLAAADFLVFEDGVPQRIAHFSRDTLPLSIVLLLDLSLSVRPQLGQIRDGAVEALGQLKPGDETAVIAFGSRAVLVQEFTRDPRAAADGVRRAVETADVGPETKLTGALAETAAFANRTARPGARRVIIVVTDNFGSEAVLKTKDALIELFASGAVVCALVPPPSRLADASPQDPFVFPLTGKTVDQFVEETGGLMAEVGSKNAGAALAELIRTLRARYALAYEPSNTRADGKMRRIRVELSPAAAKRTGKVSVRARKGYYRGRPTR